MNDAVRKLARAELGILDPEPLPALENFGLTHPIDWLWPCFLDYRRFGIYPDGKPRNQQPKKLLRDFETLSYLLNYWIQRERPKQRY